tara:strand:- start:20 stop:970 length:951 start_codon:yes stop_codon:yes gene_type:complete
MNQYKKFLGRTDLVKNQVEREKLAEQEATSKRKRSIQEQNRQRFLKYQEQLRSELAARYFSSVQSVGGESFSNTKSLNFDGTDAYLEGATNYALADGESQLNISAWLKLDYTGNGFGYLCSVKPSGGNRTFEVRIQLLNGGVTRVQFYVNTAGNNNRDTRDFGAIAGDGLWHHLMICVDLGRASRQEAKFYLDGEEKTVATAGYFASTTFPSNPSPLVIGHSLGLSDYYDGSIDELALWIGTDLYDDAKVAEIYGGGKGVDLNNLATVPAPTTWFRMGDAATIDGDDITIPDQIGTYDLTSEAMIAADVQEDTPGS